MSFKKFVEHSRRRGRREDEEDLTPKDTSSKALKST
ncbi:MAG: hypothetical protein TIS_01764 [Tissierella sp.]